MANTDGSNTKGIKRALRDIPASNWVSDALLLLTAIMTRDEEIDFARRLLQLAELSLVQQFTPQQRRLLALWLAPGAETETVWMGGVEYTLLTAFEHYAGRMRQLSGLSQKFLNRRKESGILIALSRREGCRRTSELSH
jgi:hypothetical protein